MKTFVLLSIMFLSLISFSQTSTERYQSYLNRCNTYYTTTILESGHLINSDTIWDKSTLEYFHTDDPIPLTLDLYDHNPNHWAYRQATIKLKLCKPVPYETWLKDVAYIDENGNKVGYDKLLNNLETNIKL